MSKFIYISNVRKDKILKAIQNHECYDSWGEVQYGNDERAVEYNICIDNTTEKTIYCSAFYGLLKNKEGCWQHDDDQEWYEYEIDFADNDWEAKLKEAAKKAYKELCEDYMKTKQYYIARYNEGWKKCFDEVSNDGSKDPRYDASILLDETANTEEVVGYYLVYHEKNPLKDWLNNLYIKGIDLMSEQDKEVTKILKELFRGDRMAFFCKRKTSKSKRKNVGCKGCKYYEKVFWRGHWSWRCTC